MNHQQQPGYEALAVRALRDANWDGAKVYAILSLAEAIEARSRPGRDVGRRDAGA